MRTVLSLNTVTLVSICTRGFDECRRSLESCTKAANFAGQHIFTNRAEEFPGAVCTSVEPRCREQWCVYRMSELPKHRDKFAEFMLFIESDARLARPEAWTDEFFKWDYIGAPWFDRVVGNGGFTLMSQKFLAAFTTMGIPFSVDTCFACDYKICRNYRDHFVRSGCKFAPFDVANKFSNEIGEYLGAFGVHGQHMMNRAGVK